MYTREFSSFSPERYERQIRIPDFGLEAQQRLQAATVLISRVGAVGGTVAMRLAEAGIGRLILAYGGKVTPEYLNRWPLITERDIGRACIDVVLEHLRAKNTEVVLQGEATNITEENAAPLVAQADLIVDAAPLFEERYALNRQAVRQGKPLVMAAVYGTEGYVTTIVPRETPCLVCLYPSKPDYWNSIQSFPAIGTVADLAGTIAAMEAIKLLTGFGTLLKGVLWHLDLKTNESAQFQVCRRLNCAVCGVLPHTLSE